MKENSEPLVRIYPGVRKDQKEFLEKESVKQKKGHAEFVRYVIDFYIKNRNKIKA